MQWERDPFRMRRLMISGLLLVVAALLTVLIGAWLELDLEHTALLGVAVGAVVALVPDVSVGRRLAGVALGVFVTLVGYLVRAALLPDTAGGRAVFAALVVALCVGVAAISLSRLPLWTALLGAAAFAGAFEATYDAAPPRVLENSVSMLTTLALCVAVGFLAAGIAGADRAESAAPDDHDDRTDDDTDHRATTDELLEGTK